MFPKLCPRHDVRPEYSVGEFLQPRDLLLDAIRSAGHIAYLKRHAYDDDDGRVACRTPTEATVLTLAARREDERDTQPAGG